MKVSETKDYCYANGYLSRVREDEHPGIYAITIDNFIVYVGQSRHPRERAEQHIYKMVNAFFNKEKKYQLLEAADLCGFKVDVQMIFNCDVNDLITKERALIGQLMPPLNQDTPNGMIDISGLTLITMLAKAEYKLSYPEENFSQIDRDVFDLFQEVL